MSRLNVNEKSGHRETSQVLPQFRDTKLGKLRFGSRSPNNEGSSIHSDWRMVVIFVIVDLIFFGISLTLILPLELPIPGWVIFGLWALLTFCGLICIVLICIRSRMGRKKSSDQYELGTRVDTLGTWNFPCDPVMNRAITNLVYHGEDDCEECRLLRHLEDYRRREKEWSRVSSPEMYEHVELRSSSYQVNKGFQRESPQNFNIYESKGGPHVPVEDNVENKQSSRHHTYYTDQYDANGIACSDEDLQDERFNNINNNKNAEGYFPPIQLQYPELIVTPPTNAFRDDHRNSELRKTKPQQAIDISTTIVPSSPDVNGHNYTTYKHNDKAMTNTRRHHYGTDAVTNTTPGDVTNHSDSLSSKQKPAYTRKYRQVERKPPVTKQHLAVTRRKKKAENKSSDRQRHCYVARTSSSSELSDGERTKSEDIDQSWRSNSHYAKYHTETENMTREDYRHQSLEDTVKSNFNDVTYEWIMENFDMEESDDVNQREVVTSQKDARGK